MTDHTDPLIRIRPIVGHALAHVQVAVAGLPAAAPLVHYLAASGVRRWLLADSRDGSAADCHAALLYRHGPGLGLEWEVVPEALWADAVAAAQPDLALGVACGELLASLPVHLSRLSIHPPSAAGPCTATLAFPGEPLGNTKATAPPSLRAHPQDWTWLTSLPLCAGLARAMLLRHTVYRRADLAQLWAAGVRRFAYGGSDPLGVQLGPAEEPLEDPSIRFQTPYRRRGRLLVVGLGSLGSVAACAAAPWVDAMVVVDPDHVDASNPARQAYPVAALGQAKAAALADRLRGHGVTVTPVEAALNDEDDVRRLLAQTPVDAALVTTGTAADFAIARALHAAGIPHVVGRCYPRARYWEAIVVEAQGPTFAEVRAGVRPGPAPAPTPEERAAYSSLGTLEAEPATWIESGWAAAWLARLGVQLLAPIGLRERWWLALLAAGATCILGGTEVEETNSGPAYGIGVPGQVRAWRPDQLGVQAGSPAG